MEQDMRDTIDMAREAGLHRQQHNLMSNPVQIRYSYDGYEEQLKAFEALVRADERRVERECATEEANRRANASWTLMCEKMVAAEREACAKVCEEEICSCCWDDDAQAAAEHLANTIRARGNT
jgi:hypothetical protein